MRRKEYPKGFLQFLGTAGARFVMIKQLRSTGGIWIQYRDTSCLIDPGPGALVRCLAQRPVRDPEGLEALILTHKHLDHSGDINVMIEAMTQGRRKRGRLFAPRDCFGVDGVVYSYLEDQLDITYLEVPATHRVRSVSFKTVSANQHSVQTVGLQFLFPKKVVGLISDTAYFPDLEKLFDRSDLLIFNTVFFEEQRHYEHLSFQEALAMVKRMRIGQAVFTHFGMVMLSHLTEARRQIRQEKLQKKVTLAYDGMKIPL